MHGQRRLTISSKSKSTLILVSVRTINLVEKKSFKFFPEKPVHIVVLGEGDGESDESILKKDVRLVR